MLLALGLAALAGLWWLGRTGGQLPAWLTPKRAAGYAALAVAAVLGLRGSLLPAAAIGLIGLWLLEGGAGIAARIPGFLRGAHTKPLRTATIEFDIHVLRGPVDGVVLAGPSTGRRLSHASSAELAALRSLCRESDPEALAPLEAYLDRRDARWRVDAERDRDAGPRRPFQPGAMTEEEAYQILGLQRGATLEQIRAAHRSLMKRLHPDQGGSAEGAARLNAARDRLTNRHR